MKKFLFLLFIVGCMSVKAQQNGLSAIQKGSKLNYIVYVNGDEVPLSVTLDSITTNYVKFGWSIAGYGSGGWIMKKPSLDKGNRNALEQPGLGMDTELRDNEVILLLSRATWASIQSEKKAEIDQQVFNLAKPASDQKLLINGKAVDALFVQNPTSGAKMWILNQPELPILLKIQGNAAGYDIELRSVE
jgi:hypothetical protein